MKRLLMLITILMLSASGVSADAPAQPDASAPTALRDLYFGEALYYAFQEDWFDAIARLDTELMQHYGVDEPELDTLYYHVDQAQFDVGDFELSYRMHQRAGRAITAVIEGNVEESVRNEAIFRLARMYFQKDQLKSALYAVERIEGVVPEDLHDDLDFLRAQILMGNGRFAEAARLLRGLTDDREFEGFAAYNLGIALIKGGDEPAGRRYLDFTGRIESTDELTLAIKDKANLVLGSKLLTEKDYKGAKQVLDRVRLTGPFSSRALLGSGWADAFQGRYERALVPWTVLVTRNVTDASVQEAMLALPYAYGKLDVSSKAALAYSESLGKFGAEIDKLEASIESIQEGRFLEALVREELKRDADWVVRLRELPDAPETYYLLDLMASHDFQESLKNYLDLTQLRRKVAGWKTDLGAFEQIIEHRRAYYEPLLYDIDRKFRSLDSQMRLRLEQRDRIEQRLKAMLVVPRPEYLVTAQERTMGERIDLLEQKLTLSGAAMPAETMARIERLRGVLYFDVRTEYDRRYTEAYKHLHDLDSELGLLKKRYEDFVRARQAATQSYKGYEEVISRQRLGIEKALETLDELMAQQGSLIERMAVDELTARRDRLDDLRIKARFAMADSYDRANRNQARDGRD
jgi:hypothetical protein